jgi:hypothetical protein
VYKNLSSWPIGGEISIVWKSSKVGMVYQVFKPYQWHTHINCITSMQVCKNILHHKISGYRLLHAFINCNKNIVGIFVGLLKSVNGFKALHKFALYINS